MGLDKWIKPEEEGKKKKTDEKVTNQTETPEKIPKVKEKPEKLTIKLTKQTLTCSNAKCKYQRTILKKQLTERDRICPRCSTEMKIKKVK
ncbi:MAG: hypothetical protein ACW986_00500 [Promethearchaeota archaeon]|jgi:hypothetical protein